MHRDLEDAAQARRPCRVGRVGGALERATLCRLESSGVVCNVPGHVLRVGEEVRLWLETDAAPRYFSASVLRVGVTVPDRGPDGLLIGFLQSITPEADAATDDAAAAAPSHSPDAPVLSLALPGGSSLNLLVLPVQVLQLSIAAFEFQVPSRHRLVFPRNAVLTLRVGVRAKSVQSVHVRVEGVVQGTGHLIYITVVEQVESRDHFNAAVHAIHKHMGA